MRPFRLALLCWALAATAVVSQNPDKNAPEKPYLVFDAGGHTSTVRKVLFTPDGTQVVTVSYDKTIRVWDVTTGESLRVLRLPVGPGDEGSLDPAALSPDGKTLAVSGLTVGLGKNGLIVYLVSLKSGRVERGIKGHTNVVSSLAFSPDGKLLASASFDKTVHIHDLKNAAAADKKLEGHADKINCVVFSPDGKKLATASSDKTARVWSLTNLKMTAELKGHPNGLQAVTWSSDGKTIATGGFDGSVRTWTPEGTFKKSYLDPETEQIQITSLAFRKGANEVLYTGIGKIGRTGLIDLDAGKVRMTFEGHNNTVMHGSLSADGKLAVTTGSNDHESFLWNADLILSKDR